MHEDREALRAQLLREIPAGYHPMLHLAVPSLFGLGVIALAFGQLQSVRWWEWLTLPFTYLFSNGIEWLAHRDLLHTRNRMAPVLYEQHTPRHHRLYVTEAMALQDRREFRLILIPPYGISLILLITSPVALLLWRLSNANVALLFTAMSMAYVVGYEWLHLSYHLPADHPIGRLKLIALLRRHHATHHDPKLMQRWNLNVTIPLWDAILGTRFRN